LYTSYSMAIVPHLFLGRFIT